MHIYQKHILDLLRTAPSMRYTELQPDGVESSHFKYHLNQLINDGLVEQQDRGIYALTTKGKGAVDRLSSKGVNVPLAPKVITYTLLTDGPTLMLCRKKKEPYKDLLNLVGGKVHLGESCLDAARREVDEKTGRRQDALTFRGVAEVRISDQQLISHAIAYIYAGEFIDGMQGLTAVDRAGVVSLTDGAPDLVPILQASQTSGGMFSISLDLHV